MRPPAASVCLIAQSDYQVDPRVRRKAEALVAEGYSVDVLALRPSSGEKAYTLNGVEVRTISLGKKRGSLARYVYEYAAFFVWACLRVTRQMGRRRYAVVDVNTLPDFLIFAPAAARWMGARLVLDMHEITPEFYRSKYGISERSWMVRLMTWLEKRSIDFADHVITINQPIQELLAGRGLPPAKSTVVMNAADEVRFVRESDPALAACLPARPASFVMMYHGTLTRTYGIDIAIEAFAIVHAEMSGAELWILGSGPEEEALKRLVDARGLAGKVKLFGVVPSKQIPEWLRKCDVGILSMRRDALLDFASPNKLAEFVIMGKAVAISRLKATQHYYSDDALAYFEPNDPADLASQMLRLYRDPGLRARLAATARAEYAPTRWDVMRQRYLDVIGACVQTSAAVHAPAARPPIPQARCDVAELWTMLHRAAAWIDGTEYVSYDPYDVWGTRYGQLARRLYYRKHPAGVLMTAPVLAMEIVCPWVRRALVAKDRFPTADAQLALAFLNLHEIIPSGRWLAKARTLADDLLTESTAGYSGMGWGYPFDWQNVSGLVKKGTPHITATPYCYEVFARLFDLTGEESYASLARSVARFVSEDLHDTATGAGAAASSYTPYDRSKVVNASAYRMFVLFDAARRFGDDGCREKAAKNLRFILDAQREDGSWLYAIDSPAEAFIDHFHTCFVLKNLCKVNRHLHNAAVSRAIARGYAWYRASLFDRDDNPRSFAIAPRLQLISLEMYNVAEAISLGTLLADDIPEAFALAESLAARFLRRYQLPAGYWITRIYVGGFTHRLPFLRWPQSQLFLALTNLLAAKERTALKGAPIMVPTTRTDALPRYVLVTAARNEAEFIELTIRSVVRQTVRPLKWVIVSDGSTDGTDEIVRSYVRDYPWIELVTMPPRRERHFAGKADAFNAGLARVEPLDYHVVGNVDADVSFGEGYFECLLARFAEDPSLGVGGTAFKDKSLHYDYRFVSLEHVAGPLQVFRRECLRDIGGYVASKSGGVDHIAVITARMKGWRTRTFPEWTYRHHRDMGTAAQGRVMARYKSGALDYALGGHPVFEVCRTLYQMTRPPYVVGGLALLAGYTSAAARRADRPVTRDLVRFRRQEQMHRLRAFFAGKNAAPAR